MGQFFVLPVSLFPPQVSIPSTGNAKKKVQKKAPSTPPTLVPLPCSVSPPALSQSLTPALLSYLKLCRVTPQQQSTEPLALLTQPRRESSPSSSPIDLTTSPKVLSSTASPKPPRWLPSSSPQHLTVPSPPHSTLTLSTSPKSFGLTSSVGSSEKSSPKPHQPTHAGAAKFKKRKTLEAWLKQVRQLDNSSWIRPLFYYQGHMHMYNVQCER